MTEKQIIYVICVLLSLWPVIVFIRLSRRWRNLLIVPALLLLVVIVNLLYRGLLPSITRLFSEISPPTLAIFGMVFAVALEDIYRVYFSIRLKQKFRYGIVGSSIIVGMTIGLFEGLLFGPTMLNSGMKFSTTISELTGLTILYLLILNAVIFRPIIHALFALTETGFYLCNRKMLFLVVALHILTNVLTMLAVPQIGLSPYLLVFNFARNAILVICLLILVRYLMQQNSEFRDLMNELRRSTKSGEASGSAFDRS